MVTTFLISNRLYNEIKDKLSESTIYEKQPLWLNHIRPVINDVQDKIEGLQQGFLNSVLAVDQGSQFATFPRIFSLWWLGQDEKSSNQLRFLCESPGDWHFVNETTKFNISKHFLSTKVPTYLYPLAEVSFPI